MINRPVTYFLGPSLLGLAVLFAASLSGTEWINPFGTGNDEARQILFSFRMPRVVFVFFTGAVLSLVGAVYQAILGNPLADPYILGTSSASALAVVIVGVFGVAGDSVLAGVAALAATALLTATLLYLSHRHRGRSPEKLLLFGFAANLVLSSVLFIILSARSNVLGAGSMRWLFGRIPWVSWNEVIWYGFTLLAFSAPFLVLARAINAISLGDGVCRSLGFNPILTRGLALAASSVLVAIAVANTGSIGFVGLVVPHLARRVMAVSVGRGALVIQFLAGGVFLVLADAISRSIHPPLEIPIGIVTTLLGGPIFLALLWRRAE